MIRAGQEFLWYICALHLFDTNFICVASGPQVQSSQSSLLELQGLLNPHQTKKTQLNSTQLCGKKPLLKVEFHQSYGYFRVYHSAQTVIITKSTLPRPYDPWTLHFQEVWFPQLPIIITKHQMQAKCHQDPSPRRTIGRRKFINPLGEVQQPLLDGTMQQVALRIWKQ